MTLRIALDLLLLIGLFVFPWWASMLVVLVLLFYFKHFYEAIAAGIILDALYAAPIGTLSDFQLVFTLGAIVFVGVVAYIKTKIRLYEVLET